MAAISRTLPRSANIYMIQAKDGILPQFELVDWQGDFPGDRIDRLAARQTKDHFHLPDV
jgi:hypothetical protein